MFFQSANLKFSAIIGFVHLHGSVSQIIVECKFLKISISSFYVTLSKTKTKTIVQVLVLVIVLVGLIQTMTKTKTKIRNCIFS